MMSRPGFGRVELVVVVIVIGLFAGIIAPAIYTARENGRRTLCKNRMSCIGLSLLCYETSRREYPGYANVLIRQDKQVYRDPSTKKPTPVNWTVMILPNLDRRDLDRLWRSAEAMRPRVFQEIFVCASDSRASGSGTPLSYAVNCGMADWQGSAEMPRDWQANGVFFDRFTGDNRVGGEEARRVLVEKMSNDFIMRHDGITNTLLVSENLDAGSTGDVLETQIGIIWSADGEIDRASDPPHLAPPHLGMGINGAAGPGWKAKHPAWLARPSSHHPGGVNFMFCDGHGRFVSDKIDYYVYCLLMSPDGKHVKLPGSEAAISGFGEPMMDVWLY